MEINETQTYIVGEALDAYADKLINELDRTDWDIGHKDAVKEGKLDMLRIVLEFRFLVQRALIK